LSLAAISGALLILSFPGTGDQAWLAFVALVPLLVAMRDSRWRQAAILGSVAGLVFWFGTLSWVAPTMVRYGGLPWSLAGLILAGLAGYLALYHGVFCALLTRASPRSAPLYVLGSASLWVALEFLRTYLMTGFPWNLLGYSQYRNLPLIQVAAVTGVYGVSFLVMAVNAALAWTLRRPGHWHDVAAPVATAAGLVGLAVGFWAVSPGQPAGPEIPVALIQGNIDQAVKWDPRLQDATVEAYRRLTLEAGGDRLELVIWPETAVPFFLREDARRAALEALARQVGADLLVGAPDREGGQRRNSAFLIGREGRLLDRYDKRHLVPFGEYVPLKRLLFFVDALAGGAIGEFTPGREATLVSTPLGRVGVVICYEAIFPGEVRQLFLAGAEVLVNITNDAWFGRSAAPAQHLAMAAFRAVENRAWLLRAANTGISAIVAPDGRIVRASTLFTPEVLSGTITPRAGLTLYTRYGDLFAWAAVAVAVAAALAGLGPVRLPGWRREGTTRPPEGRAATPAWRRRGVLLSLPLGAGALASALMAGRQSTRSGNRGYQEVARWQIPGGTGRIIAIGPESTLEELRSLGERLREELRGTAHAVVMVFDDPEAARQVRRGSRLVREAPFQAALAHQRAMYIKQSERGEHRLVIYERYPIPHEAIRY
jgi:apolipoprotein N-acyltransferase